MNKPKKNKSRRKKIPKKLRTIMERELKKAERKLTEHAFHIIQGNKNLLKYPENQIGNITVETMNEDWLKPTGGDWVNPATGKKEKIQISQFITYERGKVKVGEEFQETVRQVVLKPNEVKKYFDNVFLETDRSNTEISNLIESLGSDSWLNASPSQFWQSTNSFLGGKTLPFPPGPFTRQIYIYDQWKMLARAAYLVNYNPLAKAGIWIKTAFIMGTGPKINVTKEDGVRLQQEIDDFWETNDFTNRLKQYDRMLSENGEFFGELTEDEEGNCKHRSIDPGTIYDIITEPRDIEKVYGYQLIYPTQYQLYGRGARGERVPLSQFIYETAAPDNICHIKINVQENEKRGRSDLLPVLDVCQYFEDFMRFQVIRAIIQSSFTWDVTLKNADQADVEAYAQSAAGEIPIPGSKNIHNENVIMAPMQYTGGQGQGRSNTFEEIVTAFAVGFLLPKEYMNVGASGTRATAITATEPAAKIFIDRRGVWESYLRKIVYYLAKKIGVKVGPQDFEITWPEIAPENVTEKIKNILTGLQEGFITLERAAMMYAKELDIRSYDAKEEFEDIVKELRDKTLQQFYSKAVAGATLDVAGGKGGATTPAPGGNDTKPPGNQYKSPNGIDNKTKKDIKAVGKP